VVAGGGELIAAGNGAWWKPTDGGTTWAYDSAHTTSNEVKVAYCADGFKEIGDGDFRNLGACANFTRCRGAVHAEVVWLRTVDKRIERSVDGTTWKTVHTTGDYLQDVEIGYVP
jgi:hypothetical protein